MDSAKHQTEWAEYSTTPPPRTCIRRFDDGRKSRFYYWTEITPEGDELVRTGIGITSLLSLVINNPQLNDWKLKHPNDWELILETGGEYGTLLHIIYSNWLVKRSVDGALMDTARQACSAIGGSYEMVDKDLLAFIKFCTDYNVRATMIEAMLPSPDGYCVTLDLLATISVEETVVEVVQDGVWSRGKNKGLPKLIEKKTKQLVDKVYIIDHKSNVQEKEQKSFFESHQMQLIGCKRAVEANFDIKVDGVANFSPNAWRTKPGYSFKEWIITDKDNALFDCYVTIGRLKGWLEPSGSIFVAQPFTPESTSESFQIVPYKEYVREYLLKPEENNIESA